MALIYPFLVLLFLLDTRPLYTEKNDNYLSLETCNAIKVFFVCMVFLKHSCNYIKAYMGKGIIDNAFLTIPNYIGQLIVVMFLFYSGYVIYEQKKIKGKTYIKNFLKNRFVPTYLRFAVCVFLYYLLSLIIHKNYSLNRILLSFVAWNTIGNSAWFMFVTFSLYIFFYLCFNLTKNELQGVVFFSILSLFLLLFLHHFKVAAWWNTILCFPAGMWWGVLKQKIDKRLFSNFFSWFIVFICCFLIFIFFHYIAKKNIFIYLIHYILFAFVVLLFCMKFSFHKSIIFNYLGKHVFSIYMLQRLVFITLSKTSIVKHPELYLLLSFILTLVIAVLFDYCSRKIENLVKIKNKI